MRGLGDFLPFNLFPLLTAEENVMYPMEMNRTGRKEARGKAAALLEQGGLPEKIRRQLPGMMSGGEQQRVAIARALAVRGKVLLADEPTGNLDTANGQAVLSLLQRLAHEDGLCMILITTGVSPKKPISATIFRTGGWRVDFLFPPGKRLPSGCGDCRSAVFRTPAGPGF